MGEILVNIRFANDEKQYFYNVKPWLPRDTEVFKNCIIFCFNYYYVNFSSIYDLKLGLKDAAISRKEK